MKFSVLLSVYRKEQPAYLRQSLDSIFTQTLLPDEVVLVKDGPLTDALDEVAEDYCRKYPVIRGSKSKYTIFINLQVFQFIKTLQQSILHPAK